LKEASQVSSVTKVPRNLVQGLLYVGFAATGVGMALPGAVLPALLKEWRLGDAQAGLLFFLAWLGSSVGALLAEGNRRRSVAGGSLAVAVALVAMGWGGPSYWAMALYGLGLGTTMTAISLLQAARHAERRAAELSRLNMVWALGAFLCPSLAAHSLRVANVRVICEALAAVFALLSVAIAVLDGEDGDAKTKTASLPGGRLKELFRNPFALWPVWVIFLAFLPTGIESSMGGWVAEYAHRAHGSIATTVTAGSAFWGGILLSRAFSSTRFLAWRTESGLLRQSAWTVLAGALLLVMVTSSAGILCGAALVGFGLGPVYPLALAYALRYSDHAGIFFLAGVGSAFLPWLTGMVSGASASLRIGLLVPVAAGAVLVAMGYRAPDGRDSGFA